MSVLTFQGVVENGQIRLLDGAALPDKTKVYVVVRDTASRVPRLWSPRLVERGQAADFRMQVTELSQGDPATES
jgi:hypothetical protein